MAGARRGKRPGQGVTCSSTITPPCRPRAAKPSSASGPAGHGRSSGGSLVSRRPPMRRKGAPHSAVTAGGPNPRATTAAWWARSPGSRPSTSARPGATRTRSLTPRLWAASARNRARRPFASTSSHRVSGQASVRGSAGTPPPLPRSTAEAGAGPSQASWKPSACRRCGSTGPGPRKPRSRASSRTSRRRSVGDAPLSPARRPRA